MVAAPDRVLLIGSRSILREPRRREADAVAEQHRQYIHQDLVDEPPPQALAGHVGAEDLQVLAARSVQRRGDRFPDVTGEVRDLRVRRVRRPMGEDEHGSGEGVVRCCPARRLPSCSPTSQVRRPMSMAPVAAAISAKSSGAAKSASLRPPPQSIECPGPAMKPSSDIALFTTTLPVRVLESLICSSEVRDVPVSVRALQGRHYLAVDPTVDRTTDAPSERLGWLSFQLSALHHIARIGPPYLPGGNEKQAGDECSINQECDDDPAHPASEEVRALVVAEP